MASFFRLNPNQYFASVVLGVCTALLTFLSLDYIKTYEMTDSYNSLYGSPYAEYRPNVKEDETVTAEILKSTVRICTWVLTYPKNHPTKAVAVRDTWGKRVNTLIFMSSEEDPSLPSINLNITEDRSHLWAKTKGAFTYMYNHHLNDCEWFMKADDDTFVIVENLRYMLSTYDTNDPIYFGSRFKPYNPQGYMSGGGGYVLSKAALKLFVEKALVNSTLCQKSHNGAEDAEIGKCLYNVGVIAGDSRDHLGKGRFFPFEPAHHILKNFQKPDWYFSYRYYPIENGTAGCSDTAVTFHYVNPDKMYQMDYFLYHLRPFGLPTKNKYPMPLPPDLKTVPKGVLKKFNMTGAEATKENTTNQSTSDAR